MRFLLGVLTGWALLVVAALGAGAYLVRHTPSRRTTAGKCGVPGCKLAALHWMNP